MSARAKKPSRPPPSFEDGQPTIVDPKPAGAQQSSGSIQVISMKTPGMVAKPLPPAAAPVPKVKLRAISEVSPLAKAQPQNLGYLAPPRDPSEVRRRHVRDYVIYGCVAVIVASVVALGIWFLAR